MIKKSEKYQEINFGNNEEPILIQQMEINEERYTLKKFDDYSYLRAMLEKFLNLNNRTTSNINNENEDIQSVSNIEPINENLSSINIDSVHLEGFSYNESGYNDQDFLDKQFENSTNKGFSQKIPFSNGATSTYSKQYINGDLYCGVRKDGTRKYEYGIMKFADGRIYEGEFISDKAQGKGVLTFADKSVYEGEFFYGKRHGKGVIKFANGKLYEGDFFDSKIHGYGVLKFFDGRLYEGEWLDNKRHGNGDFQVC